MSHDPSRKRFLAKLIGLFAVAGVAPRLLAKPVANQPEPTPDAARNLLRPDARAVARRSDQL